MLDEVFLNLIIGLHFIFILFIIITPLVANNYFLILHAIVVPFMLLHWYVNDNNCALTLIEKQLRLSLYGEEPDPLDCFSYNLIAPVYDFKKNNEEFSTYLYVSIIALWSYSVYRLYDNWKNGKLSKLEDIILY
jgi:hypothetical protein